MGYIVVKFILYFMFGIFVLGKDVDKICDQREISKNECPEFFETCTPDSKGIGRCVCVAGLKRNVHGKCEPDPAITTPPPEAVTAASRTLPSEDDITSGSSVAAGVLIPLVVIACVLSVVFLARRYRWLQRLRQLRARHYDEMQIGQEDDDDPPIA